MKGKGMNSFNFGRPMKICGKIYHLTSDMGKAGKVMKGCSEEILQLSGDVTVPDEKKMEKVTEASRRAVDQCLGKGAFDEIFEGREIGVLDMASLIDFIRSEIEEWKREIGAKNAAGKMLAKRQEMGS